MSVVFPIALRDRLIAATSGELKWILQCIFRDPRSPAIGPAFVGRAALSKDNYIACAFVSGSGLHDIVRICTVDEIDVRLSELSRRCGLTSCEYDLLTAAVAGWIKTKGDMQNG